MLFDTHVFCCLLAHEFCVGWMGIVCLCLPPPFVSLCCGSRLSVLLFNFFWTPHLILCRPFPHFPIHARHPLRGHARPRGGRPVRPGGRGPGQPRRWPGTGPRVAVPPGRPAGLGGRALPRGRWRGSPVRHADPGRLCRALRAWRRSPTWRAAVSRVLRAKFFLPPSLRYVPTMLGFVCCLMQFVC